MDKNRQRKHYYRAYQKSPTRYITTRAVSPTSNSVHSAMHVTNHDVVRVEHLLVKTVPSTNTPTTNRPTKKTTTLNATDDLQAVLCSIGTNAFSLMLQ